MTTTKGTTMDKHYRQLYSVAFAGLAMAAGATPAEVARLRDYMAPRLVPEDPAQAAYDMVAALQLLRGGPTEQDDD